MFKVNNKDTRTTPMVVIWGLKLCFSQIDKQCSNHSRTVPLEIVELSMACHLK